MMTRAEAITHLQQFRHQCESWEIPDEEGIKALDTAIEALKAEPCEMREPTEQERKSVNNYIKSISKPTGFNAFGEPCEDCVSREFMYKLGAKCIAARNENGELVAIASIESLPSVTPEIPTSTDCVSREAVADMAGLSDWFESSDDYNDFLNELEKLPSVTPERPSVDEVCKILSDVLGTPCNYGLDGEEVSDIIPSEWCEDNCPANEDYSICWKKYFEIKYADMRE